MKKDPGSEISKSKISNRDRKEFDRLFTRYFVRLAKYAYKYVSNAEDARDLTQSVFLKIWELNGKWNPKGTIKAYLYIAVKNECINHLKHLKLVTQWKKTKQGEATRRESLKWDDEKRAKLFDEQVQRVLARMPEKRREIFQLSRDEGLTYDEIAEIKGIKKKTVESHMGRALKFLRQELKEIPKES